MPTIILSGEEELLISERLDAIKEKLLDPAWASFNFSRIVHPELKEVIDAAASVPFGPGNKVIVLDNCDLFTKKRSKGDDDSSSSKSKSKVEKVLEDLDKALAHVAPNTYLIFSCPFNFDKTLKVSKVVEKHAESIENFEKIKYYPGSTNAEMLNWCRKRAHKFNAVIEDEAIDYLAESTEGNLRMIAKEIEKTATYILPEKTITLEIISHMSPHFSNVFALLDHWISGDRRQVLSGIQELLSKQQSAIPVFAVVQTTLTKWLNIKAACERVIANLPGGRGIQRRDISPSDMAKKLQTEIKMNPWVLKMDLERVHKVELEYLVKKKQELTRLERSVKTGLLPDVHALSIFFSS